MVFKSFCFVLTLPLTLAAQVDVLTANYNNERTNANLNEIVLSTHNVKPREFGKLGAYPLDGEMFAQPLYVHGVAIAGVGRRNVIYAATMHNSVYAYDADLPQSKTPYWRVNLGPSLPTSVIKFREVDNEVGILSTPVIDKAANTIYLVAETYESSLPVLRLHALDLSDGHEKLNGPVTITASVMGIGDASENGIVTLDLMQQVQRPGLLLLKGGIYVGLGSIFDRYPFHGWIIAYDASNLQHQTGIFNVTPDGASGGVWQSGRGFAADADGYMYVASGNGDYDGQRNFGESFVKMTPSLSVVDWFAPADWKALSDVDYDLGSLGPTLIPGTNFLLGGDKANNTYLVDRTNMGHLGSEGSAAPQIVQAVTFAGIFNLALWPQSGGALVYMIEAGDWTGAFRVNNGTFDTTPVSQTPVTSDYPFQGMAISANGTAEGSGILWLTGGDHSNPDIPGTLYAFDAADLTHLLWTSDMISADNPGKFAKFANPTVANGRVYLPTFSNQIAIYGLLPRAGGRSH